MIKSGQAQTAAEVQRERLPHVSARTMRQTLQEEGLHGRRKRKVLLITPAHWKKMNKAHKDWGEAVIFSAESKFNIFGSDRIQYCLRAPNEEFEPRYVQQRLKHGGGNIMVWGCMSSKGLGRLIGIEGRMNAIQYVDVLERGLLGTLEDHNIDHSSIYFHQDTDPKHTSGLATPGTNWKSTTTANHAVRTMRTSYSQYCKRSGESCHRSIATNFMRVCHAGVTKMQVKKGSWTGHW